MIPTANRQPLTANTSTLDRAGYECFLTAKIRIDEGRGLPVDLSEINPALKDFTRLSVQWALRGGCRGIFSSFGLHKTSTQLEIMRLIAKHKGGPCLIVIPLGVRQEFFSDAIEFFRGEYAINLAFVQSTAELQAQLTANGGAISPPTAVGQPTRAAHPTLFLTNYESVREGKLDPSLFTAVSLDEADVLRSFGSKTFGEFLFGPMQRVPMRFVATATPSPNDYQELIAYAHFLGIMDIGEARTRFFKRNSERADDLTLIAHKEEEFWLWVASWALFVQKPSDLGFSDDGYTLPPLDVRWHEIPSDHKDAGSTKRGQGLLLRNEAIGVVDASREKRDSLEARLAKVMEIRTEAPDAHRIIWHDLEDERKAIEASCEGCEAVYGSQTDRDKESTIVAFRNGEIQELAAKPVMLGGGCNFQKYCHWAIFMGIGFKFRDFIQAIHRLQRFGQAHTVRIDLIYTEAERKVKDDLMRKWRQHEELVANMTRIIREFGLSEGSLAKGLQRSFGVERREERSTANTDPLTANGEASQPPTATATPAWLLACNDSVIETADMDDDSVDMVLTSIPFSTQYEYTPSYNDFGHTDDEEHFFEQMGFLTPELLRVLRPGRIAAVHVKDRIVPGAMTGLSYPTVSPFHVHCTMHFLKHGFTMITVTTDVVRENNQTYRLGWTEQCKDGSVKGVGMPEYVLLFRKAPTTNENGYADEPVKKTKEEYTLARWQIDAHAFWRSSGNRLLEPEDFRGLRKRDVYRLFRGHNYTNVYDFESHVRIAGQLDEWNQLPTDFALIPPQSWHPDVWSDIMRARTLNARQASKGREKHICPLQLDIVDRLIVRYSNPGELVYDPFAGIGTVPHQALRLGRRARGSELNAGYWADSVFWARHAEAHRQTTTLFDALEIETEDLAEIAG